MCTLRAVRYSLHLGKFESVRQHRLLKRRELFHAFDVVRVVFRVVVFIRQCVSKHDVASVHLRVRREPEHDGSSKRARTLAYASFSGSTVKKS